MKIGPMETEIRGGWKLKGGSPVADDACRRIDELVNDHLQEIGSDESGWNTLFLDPDDGRYWELVYPQSELFGGGPSLLRNLTSEQAADKYGFDCNG